ncbi:T9SS type A sorting domain-containing protein [Chitinophagaceae bacterium MMS25-I14]
MKQLNTGSTNSSPVTLHNSGRITRKQKGAASLFSKSKAMLSGAIIAISALFSFNADATPIPTVSLTCTQATTATTSCVNGFFASNWTSGTGYWLYTVNTTGYTGVTMTFNTSSSATGPTTGLVYYNIGAGDVLVGSYTVNTSCASKSITLPAACNNVASLTVKLKMSGATATGGTNRVPSNGGFDGTSAGCTGTPAAGTASASVSSICGSGTSVLSLSGATSGSGITYQWQSSPDNATWSNISGATNLTYNTPTLSATTYYRAVTTCTTSGLSATTASAAVTVNALPSVAAITGISSSPLVVAATATLADATTGGAWLSSDNTVATINALTGVVTGVKGGTTTISYQVTDGVTGCSNSAVAPLNVVWPNTLALYAGANGNSTNVITVPGETASATAATAFGAPATPCTSGGISGLTVNVANNAYNSDSAHVSYIITPNAGQALNVFRIHAVTRESGTGPAKARIAYRINGGAWIDEGRDVAQNTGGSCGAASTSWDFTTPAGQNLTVNGITTNIEVAVFPYAPGASTGTFQLNSLEVYGTVTSSTPCSGTPNAGTVTAAFVNICDSGSRFLNFTGDAGVGISYQWQSSTNNVTFSNISGATNASYNTGMLHAGVTPPVTYYRVVTTCSGSGLSNASIADTVNVHATPANAGFISNTSLIPADPTVFYDRLQIGASSTWTSTVAGGTWSSNDTSAISIVSNTGVSTPHIPGDAVITYRAAVNGCFGVTRDTVISYYPNTVALYVGRYGNSTNIYASGDLTATPLTATNWGATTACGNGGISGLTNTNTAANTATNGQVSFHLASAGVGTFNVTGIHATLRQTSTAAYQAYLGYNNGAWTTTAPVAVSSDDCGYSHDEIFWDLTSAPLSIDATGSDIAVFGYNGTSTLGLQINSIDVIGDATAIRPASVSNITKASDVQLFPNPATSVLNVAANETVNVTILSIDGKKLIDQKAATQINVSSLASGMYLIQVYNTNGNLIKTAKFSKQ